MGARSSTAADTDWKGPPPAWRSMSRVDYLAALHHEIARALGAPNELTAIVTEYAAQPVGIFPLSAPLNVSVPAPSSDAAAPF
jgi:hypothetical protein